MASKNQLYANRRKWFVHLFEEVKGLDIPGVAKALGFSHDKLYRKTTGYSRFSEEECKKLMGYLGLSFEEIFQQKYVKKGDFD